LEGKIKTNGRGLVVPCPSATEQTGAMGRAIKCRFKKEKKTKWKSLTVLKETRDDLIN
jgi:hypothetical protein